MNKYLKLLTVVMLLFVTSFNVIAEDDSAPDFDITAVTIEGVEFDDFEDINIYAPVYLDSEIEIKVEWLGTGNDTEAKIVLEFDGDDVKTDYFDVKDNYHGSETITIEIDDDEDLVGLKDLEIVMRSKDGDFLERIVISLDIVREDNLVEIFDVNFRNGLQANAGEVFTASVGVANEGNTEEEDAYVIMSIPELGYLQELIDLI